MLLKVVKSSKGWWPFSGYKTTFRALEKGSLQAVIPSFGLHIVSIEKDQILTKKTKEKMIINKNIFVKNDDLFLVS